MRFEIFHVDKFGQRKTIEYKHGAEISVAHGKTFIMSGGKISYVVPDNCGVTEYE